MQMINMKNIFDYVHGHLIINFHMKFYLFILFLINHSVPCLQKFFFYLDHLTFFFSFNFFKKQFDHRKHISNTYTFFLG